MRSELTRKELDERIDGIGKDYWHDGITSQSRDDIKQLIRDCIEAVTPERLDDDIEANSYAKGRNGTIDDLKFYTKELLGPSK